MPRDGGYGDLSRAFLGGFGMGLELSDRWAETRAIVEDRELRLKADADYRRHLDEKVLPLRAVREALGAELSRTQLKMQRAMAGQGGGSLVDLAEIQARYHTQLDEFMRTGIEALGREEQLWHEYVNTDSGNGYKARQAAGELQNLLATEKRLTESVAGVAGTYGQLISATKDERKLDIEQQQADAYSLQAANAGSGGDPFAERKLDLDERALDLRERQLDEGGGEPLKPKDRIAVLRSIDQQLGQEAMGFGRKEGDDVPPHLVEWAARLRPVGLTFDPKEAAENPDVALAMRNAVRAQLMYDRGQELGDTQLVEQGSRRLGDVVETWLDRQKKNQPGAHGQIKAALQKFRSQPDEMNDEELADLQARVRGAREKINKRYLGIDNLEAFPESERATARAEQQRFRKAVSLEKKIAESRKKKQRASMVLSAEAASELDELLGGE